MTGQTVGKGRYRLEKELGAGSMGRVYLAFDQSHKTWVAVKVLAAQQAVDRQALQRFVREAQMLSQLRHPNIVQLLDTFEENGSYYLVMEYVDGETLQQKLRKGPLPVEQMVAYADAICQALSYAHSRGVIHRDIKVGNVLIGRDQTVKVGDFGIARLVTEATKDALPSGSLESMAPEVIRGMPADERSDVYSVGVVLYHMLTGRPPFQAEEAAAIAYQHVVTPPPRLDRVPEALSRVVLMALAKDPQARYPSAQALRAAIRAAAASGHAPPTSSPVRYSRGRGWVAVLTGLLLVLLLVLIAYLILYHAIAPLDSVEVSTPTPTAAIKTPAMPTLPATMVAKVLQNTRPAPTAKTATRRPAATAVSTSPSPAAETLAPTSVQPQVATAVPVTKIAYTVSITPRQHYKIFLVNADGSGQRELADSASEPSFAPDGRHLVYYAWPDGLYTMAADGSDRRKIVGDVEAAFPDWSPDGNKIAFHSLRGGSSHFSIYVVNADGSDERMITDGEQPSWAPNGSQLAYKGCLGNDCGLMVINLDGSGKRRLTTFADDGNPAWSPDGRQIAFTSHRDGNHEIYVMDADGTSQRRLTNTPQTEGLPTWLPGGQYLAFRSDRDGQWAIYIMRVDGTGVRKITNAAVAPDRWIWEKMDASD